jgi:hypothetical protein
MFGEISLERSLSAYRGRHKEVRQEHDEAQERNGKKDGCGSLAHVDRVMFHMTDFYGVSPALVKKSDHLPTRYIEKSTFARAVKDSKSVFYISSLNVLHSYRIPDLPHS